MLFFTRSVNSSQCLIKLEFSGRSFEKSPNVKLHENPSIERRDVPCHAEGQIYRRTDEMTDRQTVIRNFTKPLKITVTGYI